MSSLFSKLNLANKIVRIFIIKRFLNGHLTIRHQNVKIKGSKGTKNQFSLIFIVSNAINKRHFFSFY